MGAVHGLSRRQQEVVTHITLADINSAFFLMGVGLSRDEQKIELLHVELHL